WRRLCGRIHSRCAGRNTRHARKVVTVATLEVHFYGRFYNPLPSHFARKILLGVNHTSIGIKLNTGKIREELTGLLQDIDKLFDIVDRSLGEFGRNQELQQIKTSARQHIKEILKAI
ncbi:MAG: hypothetical protein ABSF09_09110, partial [Candidatus Bathyarchaeia archaeon]